VSAGSPTTTGRARRSSERRWSRTCSRRSSDHRRQAVDDGIGRLIAAQIEADDAFCLDEVLTQLYALVGGGLKNTSYYLASSMLELLHHPEQQARAREDPSALEAVLEEALRLEPPSLWHPRRVAQPATLDGTDIPAGAFVLLMVAAANRDPARFDDPDRFAAGVRTSLTTSPSATAATSASMLPSHGSRPASPSRDS